MISEDFFLEDQPKETTFKYKTNKNYQNFSKNHQKKNHKQKKKQDHDGSSKKVEEKDEKTTVFFVKFAKRLMTMKKNVGTKASPKVTFV